MRGFRARDADRDRYVEVIEAAYVDGQINDADRELRVSRALSAETLDELETLTRDLQNRPAPAPPVQVRAARPTRTRHLTGVLVALGVFVALIGVGVTGVVALFATSVGPTEVDTPAVVASDGTTSLPAEEVEAPPAPTFEMTARDVRGFVRAYERQFGTRDAWDVSFYPERVSVDVPVRGSRPRYESWSWDGAWEMTSGPRGASPFHTALVDLGSIGPDRLMANIRLAERSLGVERGVFTHAVLWDDPTAGTTLNIHVGNEFQENGYLRTTLSGDRVVLRIPYDG
ncbi:hypothetical protein F4692_002642 [Nocardioides cavernae]|uniref:DUF1707 domain-containing protein n=1 Tax=Nocardioides cavernae TaxID=1921566 RepID=A0A7Y9H5A9_9ACTN|nr:DUF1707 domain-containing protein [Nocardioides cavernae]NYE37509.1 hypothetical protein [Nocardioides cavernae]